MILSECGISTANIANVLGYIRGKGVKLWVENDNLCYQAPKGALTLDDISRLKAAKDHIVTLLQGPTTLEPIAARSKPCRPRERLPLTYSQLSHWHLYGLGQRRHIRQIASATRLSGRLNIDALHRSFDELLRQHDALRIRIIVVDEVPMQEICPSCDYEIVMDDLTTLTEDLLEAEVKRRIDAYVLEKIDVTVGPLFGVLLLRLRDEEHVLIMTMEHMIADGISMNILLRDLFTAYRQAAKGVPIFLPVASLQFADYAAWQRKTQESWLGRHAGYWKSHLAGCQRVRFPDDRGLSAETRAGWGIVPMKIGVDLKAELLGSCRQQGTTLVMSVLTAYAALALRWCSSREIVIRYVSDGRIDPALENTIGYFAFMLFLRLELSESESDTFLNLQKRLTEEYCSAQEHPQLGYIESQAPMPEFARGCGFNWIPQGKENDFYDSHTSGESVVFSPFSFEHPMLRRLERDSEPFVMLYDTDKEIVGGIHFPLSRFSDRTMERFERNFRGFIQALARRPEVCVRDIPLR